MTRKSDGPPFERTPTGEVHRSDRPSSPGGHRYEIRVRGHLDAKWQTWLEDLDVELLDGGEMVLSGLLVDQAALIGVLDKLHRLNLTVLSVNPVVRKTRI